MKETAAAPIADEPAMNIGVTQHEVPQQPRGGLRFAFPSGSRPLAGYTIKRGLGRGGFGEVYYALSDAGKEVALKLIRSNLDIELRGVTQCLNLKHPHLVALYDVKQDDQDNSWVVMEYVSGQSLEEVMQQHPSGLPAEEAVTWLRGIASGVAYLHDHGIVHRDLKPGNIFSDEGVVKLGDYGLSKFISCSRRSGQTESIGTVHYMAPEVANGRYGKEIDIYALGIILYEMLTGHVPFEGESIGEVLMKHLTAQPDLTPLAEPYRTIVERALAKDPTLRFASVEELMACLPSQAGPFGPALVGRVGTKQASADAHGPAVQVVGYKRPREQQAYKPQSPGFPQASDVKPAPEEPIARAVSKAWNEFLGYSTGFKIGIIVLAFFLLSAAGRPIIMTPVVLAFTVALGYGVYYVLWLAFLQNAQAPPNLRWPKPAHDPTPPREPSRAAPAPAAVQVARPRARNQWHRKAEPVLVLKSSRERLVDLLGSMLLSAGVTAALAFVMLLLRGEPPRPEHYAWLTIVSTAGAWLVLVVGKLWEGTRGDVALRRFAMLLMGLALGVFSYYVADALLVQLPLYDSWLGTDPMRLTKLQLSRAFYDANGRPLLYAYVSYFGFLFLIVRWWRQSDPLRPTRLSLWAVAVSIMAAWLVNQFWTFPQPWGLMAAACMSLSLQLSSPWMRRERSSRQFG